MAEKQEMASTDEVSDGKSHENIGDVEVSTFGFGVKSEKSDLVLLVENRPLYVKRYVLEDASPVFEAMFDTKLKENSTFELTIEDESCGDFAEFLACIQPRRKQKISKDNVFRMLHFADKYEVEDLKDRCEDRLLRMLESYPPKTDLVLTLLHYAYTFGLDDLKKSCLAHASKAAIDGITSSKSLKRLASEAKCALYETVLPGLSSKSHIMDFMMSMFSKEDASAYGQFTDAKHVCMSFKNGKGEQVFKFKRWDIGWNVQLSLQSSYSEIQLTCDTQYTTRAFTCHIGMCLIILNNIPWKENLRKNCFYVFDSSKKDSFKGLFSKYSDIDDKSLGFTMDNQTTWNVHLIVDKPVYK